MLYYVAYSVATICNNVRYQRASLFKLVSQNTIYQEQTSALYFIFTSIDAGYNNIPVFIAENVCIEVFLSSYVSLLTVICLSKM